MRWFSGRTSGSGSWLRERDDVIRGEMGRKDIGDVTSSRISRRSRHLVYLGGHGNGGTFLLEYSFRSIYKYFPTGIA